MQPKVKSVSRGKRQRLGCCCFAVWLVVFSVAAVAAQETVKVGVPGRGLTFLPAEFGMAKGFFQREGVALNLTRMSVDVSFSALASGELDFVLTVLEGMRANIRGLVPVKIVGGMVNAPDWFIYGQPDIKELKELKGRVIAAGSPKGEVSLATGFALRRAGLYPEKREVSFVSIPDTPGRIAALQNRTINAATIASPGHFKAKQLGFNELAGLGDIVPLPIVAWATAEKRVKENPAQIRKILRATLRSIAYVLKNRDETAEYVAKNYGMEKSEALAAVIAEEKHYAVTGEIPEEGLQIALQLLKNAGDIEHMSYPLSRFMDFSLLREVHKELQR